MALLVASNGCMGEKIEDKVGKICHIVISDVIKPGLSAVRRGVFVVGNGSRWPKARTT